MQLSLTDRETELLRDLFHDYLPRLQLEVARTEERTLRHELGERQDLVEHLLELLDSSASRH